MARYKDLITALNIFEIYEPGKSMGGAEHDVIYGCGTSPDKMTGAERSALKKSGWNWDEEEECWRRFV